MISRTFGLRMDSLGYMQTVDIHCTDMVDTLDSIDTLDTLGKRRLDLAGL